MVIDVLPLKVLVWWDNFSWEKCWEADGGIKITIEESDT